MNYIINKIEFVLENCEVIELTIWRNFLFHSRFNDVRTSIDAQEEQLFENRSCYEYAVLSLDSRYKENFKITNDGSSGKTAFERLQYGDITSVVFKTAYGGEHQIYVPWKGNGTINKACKITEKDGKILIKFDCRPWWKKLIKWW